MSDSAEFGSFTNAFLTCFRDDFAKLPCVTFPFLSTLTTASGVEDDVSAFGWYFCRYRLTSFVVSPAA